MTLAYDMWVCARDEGPISAPDLAAQFGVVPARVYDLKRDGHLVRETQSRPVLYRAVGSGPRQSVTWAAEHITAWMAEYRSTYREYAADIGITPAHAYSRCRSAEARGWLRRIDEIAPRGSGKPSAVYAASPEGLRAIGRRDV